MQYRLNARYRGWALATLLALGSGGLASTAQDASAATVCGPGDHWIDTCVPMTQTWSVHMEFGLDRDLDGVVDEEAVFDGYVVVQNDAPYESRPRADPGHLNEMTTTIQDMSLNGTSANVSGWTMRAGIAQGLAPTSGYAQEHSSDPSSAGNRFDMVFVIDGTPYGRLHHDGSFFFEAALTSFPQAGADYKHLGAPFGTSFPLYDENGTWAMSIKDLFETDHVSIGRPHFVVTAVVPIPAAIGLFGAGLALLGLVGRASQCRPDRRHA